MKTRLIGHLTEARCGAQSCRAQWIRSLQAEGLEPSVNVVAIVERDAWEAAEKWWIAKLRALGFDLVNGTIGGKGKLGNVPSAEARRKLSETTKGRQRFGDPARWKHSAASREKIRKAGIGRVFSAESRAKKSAALSGENGPKAKMTREQVIDIRSRENQTVTAIALEFGVSRRNIGMILLRQTWKNV